MDGRDVVTFSVKRMSILSETELLLTTTVIEVAFAMAGRVAAKRMVEIAAIRMRRSGLEVNVGNWPSSIRGRTWRYTLYICAGQPLSCDTPACVLRESQMHVPGVRG